MRFRGYRGRASSVERINSGGGRRGRVNRMIFHIIGGEESDSGNALKGYFSVQLSLQKYVKRERFSKEIEMFAPSQKSL